MPRKEKSGVFFCGSAAVLAPLCYPAAGGGGVCSKPLSRAMSFTALWGNHQAFILSTRVSLESRLIPGGLLPVPTLFLFMSLPDAARERVRQPHPSSEECRLGSPASLGFLSRNIKRQSASGGAGVYWLPAGSRLLPHAPWLCRKLIACRKERLQDEAMWESVPLDKNEGLEEPGLRL